MTYRCGWGNGGDEELENHDHSRTDTTTDSKTSTWEHTENRKDAHHHILGQRLIISSIAAYAPS